MLILQKCEQPEILGCVKCSQKYANMNFWRSHI